jgi:hypothetical protein
MLMQGVVNLTDEQATMARAAALLALTIALCLIGMAVVVFLFISWRRFALRDWYQRRKASRLPPKPDIWQAAGDRLVMKIDQKRKKPPSDTPPEPE